MHSMRQRQTATSREAERQSPTMAALWLILATIFAQALLPVGSPMARASGSAFSASTSEVSLAPARGASAFFVQQEGGSSAGLGGGDPADPPAAILPSRPYALASARAATPPLPTAPELSRRPAKSQPYAPRAPPA